jgi:hypothetical protein
MWQRGALGPVLRMAGGGDAAVSRATEGRALGGSEKLLSIAREGAWPKILGHVHLMRDTPVLHAYPFS